MGTFHINSIQSVPMANVSLEQAWNDVQSQPIDTFLPLELQPRELRHIVSNERYYLRHLGTDTQELSLPSYMYALPAQTPTYQAIKEFFEHEGIPRELTSTNGKLWTSINGIATYVTSHAMYWAGNTMTPTLNQLLAQLITVNFSRSADYEPNKDHVPFSSKPLSDTKLELLIRVQSARIINGLDYEPFTPTSPLGKQVVQNFEQRREFSEKEQDRYYGSPLIHINESSPLYQGLTQWYESDPLTQQIVMTDLSTVIADPDHDGLWLASFSSNGDQLDTGTYLDALNALCGMSTPLLNKELAQEQTIEGLVEFLHGNRPSFAQVLRNEHILTAHQEISFANEKERHEELSHWGRLAHHEHSIEEHIPLGKKGIRNLIKQQTQEKLRSNQPSINEQRQQLSR